MTAVLRFLLVVIPLLLLGGCAETPRIVEVPKVDAADASGIGIEVKTIGGSSWSSAPKEVSAVYFAKVCETKADCDGSLYPSNYAKEGRLYFLNTAMGDYEAVAASTVLGSGKDQSSFFTYFPVEMVRQSRVSVSKGKLAYAGSYVLTMSRGVCPNEADETQVFYAEKIEPGTAKCGLVNEIVGKISDKMRKGDFFVMLGQVYTTGGYTYHYRGSIKEAIHDQAHEDAFLAKARADLSSGGWHLQP